MGRIVRICNVTWIGASASALALSALYGSEFATSSDLTLRPARARTAISRRFFERRFRGDFFKSAIVSRRRREWWPVKFYQPEQVRANAAGLSKRAL
jgi:hypothetical protein